MIASRSCITRNPGKQSKKAPETSGAMGCTVSRLKAEGAARVCVTSLEESCQTGDLVLFSSRHAASQMTKCFTGSAWDHCGLVVKLSPKHVLILEYAGGVYLYPLFTRLCTPPQIELARSRSAAKSRGPHVSASSFQTISHPHSQIPTMLFKGERL